MGLAGPRPEGVRWMLLSDPRLPLRIWEDFSKSFTLFPVAKGVEEPLPGTKYTMDKISIKAHSFFKYILNLNTEMYNVCESRNPHIKGF